MPNRTRSARQASSTKRGYNHDHRNNRTALLNRHADGKPCWWCGLPMFKDRRRNWDYDPNAKRSDGLPDEGSGQLEADHTDTQAQHGIGKTRADRLLHRICNRQRGDGTRDHLRPALTRTADTESPLGILVMDWPT